MNDREYDCCDGLYGLHALWCPSRGCGMYVFRSDGVDGATVHVCDRPKWHEGECSTLAMRHAARQEADR